MKKALLAFNKIKYKIKIAFLGLLSGKLIGMCFIPSLTGLIFLSVYTTDVFFKGVKSLFVICTFSQTSHLCFSPFVQGLVSGVNPDKTADKYQLQSYWR